MTEKEEIAEIEKDTENIISSALTGLVEGMTGVTTSSKKELILSISHTYQRMRGGHFLSVLGEEWNKYRERGKVKDDYQFTEQHKVCLQELLDFLENDSPDEIRFNILKQVFLVAAAEEVKDRNCPLPQQFMKIARSLTDGEVIILTTVWQIAKNHEGSYSGSAAANWLNEVTEASGLVYPELVEIHEQGLIDKKLLTDRRLGDRSGVVLNPHFRLSSLAYDFCSYISSYDE